MFLGVVRKVYWRHVGEHSQRLAESKVDVTLSQAGEEGEGREEQMQHPGGSKVQNEWVTKMVELYKVGQLGEGKTSPWAEEI